MQYLSADCILPVSGAPIYNEVLVLNDAGTVEGIYKKNQIPNAPSEIRHFNGLLCPGFVNTHCHLELSWAKGLLSAGEGLSKFIWQLEKYKKSVSEKYILRSIETAAYHMAASGVVATGDIANGKNTLRYKQLSKQYFHTFIEIFGSDPSAAGAIFEQALELKTLFESQTAGKSSIVPHSAYSLSAQLFAYFSNLTNTEILSIHHQENEDENLFFQDGSGPISARRKAFNPDLEEFKGTGKRPLESIAQNFSREQKILLVHNTVTQHKDIEYAKTYFKNAYWCFCPNANLFIENALPDIPLFQKSGCKITLGTDSLASNSSLSILDEMKTIQRNFESITLQELIGWASLNGAEFLGIASQLGSFEKGKTPGVVLIENMDIENLKLKPESTSRLLIGASI